MILVSVLEAFFPEPTIPSQRQKASPAIEDKEQAGKPSVPIRLCHVDDCPDEGCPYECQGQAWLGAYFDAWDLMYDDDTLIVGRACTDVEHILHEVERHLRKYNLALNRKKCNHVDLQLES